MHFKRHVDVPYISDGIRKGLSYIQEKILSRGSKVHKDKPVYKEKPDLLSLLGLGTAQNPSLGDIAGTEKVVNIDTSRLHMSGSEDNNHKQANKAFVSSSILYIGGGY